MKCSNCGSDIDVDSVYCLSCGHKTKKNYEKQIKEENIMWQVKNKTCVSSSSKLNIKLYPGSTVFGILLIPVLNIILRVFFNMNSSNTVIAWVYCGSIVVFACIALYSAWYDFSCYPNLLKKYEEGDSNSKNNLITIDGKRSVSYYNGLCGGLFGFLFNYNIQNNKVGISCYVIGVLQIIVSIIYIFLAISVFSVLA